MQRGVCFLLLILVLQGAFSPMCGMRVCAAEDPQAAQTDVTDAEEIPDRAEEGDDLKTEVETLRADLEALRAEYEETNKQVKENRRRISTMTALGILVCCLAYLHRK